MRKAARIFSPPSSPKWAFTAASRSCWVRDCLSPLDPKEVNSAMTLPTMVGFCREEALKSPSRGSQV